MSIIENLTSDRANWMSRLSDSLSLRDLSIPGTHDSGTECVAKGIAHCQNHSILKQLEEGVRFLDVRLKKDGGTLKVVHGIVDCKIDFKKVLEWCLNFLETNPRETILMCVKNDGDANIAQLFLDHVNDSKYKSLFLQTNKVPTLGDARGKIVFFRRFNSGDIEDYKEFGINWIVGWKDNTVFDINTDQGDKFTVEDCYNESNTNKKLDVVKKTLGKSLNDSARMFVTFCSIASGYGRLINTPYRYAWGGGTVDPAVNPKVYEYIAYRGYNKRFGIVIADFYNDEGADNYLVDSIIRSNFKAPSNDTIEDKGIYQILCKCSLKHIDINGRKKEDNVEAVIWTPYDAESQQFSFEHVDKDTYRIVAVHSGKCLEPTGSKNRDKVVQKAISNSDNQLWLLEEKEEGWLALKSKTSGLYLDVNNGNKHNGNSMVVYEANGTDAQRFNLHRFKVVTNTNNSVNASKAVTVKSK
ncbi:phosphatidylinositol-specific phospholipase C domain-containing protein [Anaerosporobacter sp.]|uniref:phosphatidylinositol-specific phospholipase C domain-containing protein n=1 Tax=Anaerosporobacter sp. TaxID=1872529 RepID=UPI00286EEA6B|nr:phosphatidylinositol-specific phospholipase C domain-containing protein [Anaerosporobacter sp.]